MPRSFVLDTSASYSPPVIECIGKKLRTASAGSECLPRTLYGFTSDVLRLKESHANSEIAAANRQLAFIKKALFRPALPIPIGLLRGAAGVTKPFCYDSRGVSLRKVASHRTNSYFDHSLISAV